MMNKNELTELLSNVDLQNYCKLFDIPLNNVLSKDLFATIQPKLGCYIINIQDHDVGNGTHWTCLILTKSTAIYFDSYGISIPSDILQFIKRFNTLEKIIYSIDQIQSMKSIYCGWYCIYFLYFITVLHKKCTNYRYLLNKHNSIYSFKLKCINDQILRRLVFDIYKKIKN